jgi:hypothetical protein
VYATLSRHVKQRSSALGFRLARGSASKGKGFNGSWTLACVCILPARAFQPPYRRGRDTAGSRWRWHTGVCLAAARTGPGSGLPVTGPLTANAHLACCRFAAAVIVALLTSPPRFASSILEQPTLVWLRQIPYGLYRWHVPIFSGVLNQAPMVRLSSRSALRCEKTGWRWGVPLSGCESSVIANGHGDRSGYRCPDRSLPRHCCSGSDSRAGSWPASCCCPMSAGPPLSSSVSLPC